MIPFLLIVIFLALCFKVGQVMIEDFGRWHK